MRSTDVFPLLYKKTALCMLPNLHKKSGMHLVMQYELWPLIFKFAVEKIRKYRPNMHSRDSSLLTQLAINEKTRFTGYNLTLSFSISAHPLEVSLQPDKSIISVQRGSSMMLSCNSSGCSHAHITWQNVTHQSLLSWNDTNAFVSQLGPWTVGLEDNQTFICEVKCGSVIMSKRTELKVFCKYHSNITYNNYIFVLILSIHF